MDYLLKPIVGEVATLVSELESCAIDLEGARDSLTRMKATRDPDLLLMHWECAVIRYGRVFSTGVRVLANTKSLADALPPEIRVIHEEILDERSKHTAHSINDMEQTVTVFKLADPAKGRKAEYLGSGTVHFRRAPINAEVSARFLRLIDCALERIREAQKELLAEIDRTLKSQPLEVLYEADNLAVRPSKASSSRQRKAAQHKGRSRT